MNKISSIEIKQGTTPIVTAVLEGQAIQDATVYLSIRAKNRLIVKSNYCENSGMLLEPVYDEDDVQVGTSITVQLTQCETLCLKPGAARVEVGWVFEDGSADKSNIGLMTITPSLLKGVMRYGKHSS